MALRINELFNGANGVALDITNTSATGFTGVGTSVFDTSVFAEGTASAKFSTTTALRQAQWTLTSVTDGYVSFYIVPQGLPSANVILLMLGTNPSTPACTVVYQTTGVMKVSNSAGVIISTTTTDALVLNELNRIDLTFNSGTVKLEVYPGNAVAHSPVGTATVGNTRSGTTAVTAYAYRALGHGTSCTLVSSFDSFREADLALPGPVGASALAASVVVVPASGTIPLLVTATCSTTGGTATAKTYAWAWGDGGTNAAVASNSATHTYSTAGTFTVVCTVTN